MRHNFGGKSGSRVFLAAAFAITCAGAAAVAVAEPAPNVALPGAPIVAVVGDIPSPADVVQRTGSWFAHGYTLELRPDGTGTFAVWMGAFDGDRIRMSLIPAPGPATVAEIVGIETVGAGALVPGLRPGVGGLVTIAFDEQDRTARVEWTSGADRQTAVLCPASGLDAAAMGNLRCGA